METSNKANTDRMYEHLIQRFIKWAETRSDVRAAVVVGSRARVNRPADEWADLDMMIVTKDPESYLSKTDWVENIGTHILTFLEPTSTGDDTERRVLFKDMLDVDFAIIPESMARQLVEKGIPLEMSTELSDVFGRGIRVLIDKDGLTAKLTSAVSTIERSTPRMPTQQEFLQVANDFLYHAVFTAKHLRRGELWWAITCCNCHMQRLLLQITEWHAHATRGLDYDTWFRGRFLEEWADPRVLEELRSAFAHYDKDDVSRSLLSSMALFRWLSKETAEKLGYTYPTEADECVTKWVRNCLSARS
jgi:aminoglycoside 6-adenylyltransferase